MKTRDFYLLLILLLSLPTIYQNCEKVSFSRGPGEGAGLVPPATPPTCESPAQVTMTVSYINAGNSQPAVINVPDHQTNYSINYRFTDGLGRFEKRPDNDCGNPAVNNPTYVKVSFSSSRPITSCRYQASWDNGQWLNCQSWHVNTVNAGQSVVINTDTFQSDVSQLHCPQTATPHTPVNTSAWFKVQLLESGCTYDRLINLHRAP